MGKFTVLFFLLVLTSCETTSKEQLPLPFSPTYVLILTDTSMGTSQWVVDYRKEQLNRAKVVVSGFPGEAAAAVLARLPWLLQPGVDTLLIDTAFLQNPARLCDSVRKWSPSTVCR